MRAEKSHSPTSVYAEDTNIIVKAGYHKDLRKNMENLDVNKDIELSLISALPRSKLSIPLGNHNRSRESNFGEEGFPYK